MGVYGAIGGAVLGGIGGIIKNKGERDRLNKIMEGASKYKNGVPRMYGAEQDSLIKALQSAGPEQAIASGNVARSELGKQLGQAEGQAGGIAGVRAAMTSGQEAGLAGGIGRAAGAERVGNLQGASTNISQAASNALARERLRLDALRMYNEAKGARKSGFNAFAGGAANGAMAGAALPV